MAEVVTDQLLSRLEALYPASEARISPWSFVAATAFSASNLPDAVPIVYEYALRKLSTDDDRLQLTRKFRDALFKSGLLSGYPKAINALAKLNVVVPEHLKDKLILRDTSTTTENFIRAGQEYFSHTYGDTTADVQTFLRDIYPDLEYFSTAFGYGYVYSFSQVLSPAETSFTMVAALIASDVPPQVVWHLRGAVRNGASEAEILAVRKISIEASSAAGVVWKNDIPDIQL